MEIVVDAYDEIERVLGWYYYLKDNLYFPFSATCISKRATSCHGPFTRTKAHFGRDFTVNHSFFEFPSFYLKS